MTEFAKPCPLCGQMPINQGHSVYETLFTEAEAAVAEGVRLGKATKVIAYELGLSDRTVNAHIYKIMRKMRASNRNEVTYKLNTGMLGEQG